MSTKKVVLITGGTSGIGKELAKCFAINGYTVIVVGRDEKRLEKTAEEFKKNYGAEIMQIQVDLSEPNAAEKVFAALNGRSIDVLINNASVALHGPFAETEDDDLVRSIRINVETMTHLTRLVLPQMIDRRSGKILNVSATAAFQPGPMMATFYAAKAYVLSFSEALRYELRGTGVTVTTLCPGPTDTPFHKKTQLTNSNLFRTGMMQPDDVARRAYRDLLDNRAIVVPGFKNKMGMILVKFSPRPWVLVAMSKLHKTR
jgi:short-subunit dehydrogenase